MLNDFILVARTAGASYNHGCSVAEVDVCESNGTIRRAANELLSCELLEVDGV